MKLRGALLGAGNIALRGHGPQWSGDPRLREDVEIVAIADLSSSNLQAAREMFPKAALYERAEELLEQETLDFCDICTPPFTHRALIEDAAERGIDIVCEKPLAPTLADAERIADVVHATGIVFQPCHQYHCSPQWLAVRSLLPRIGRVYFAEYEVARMGANEGNPNWAPTWRTDQKYSGGGILVDHGAHIFYQLRAALGEPRTVQATVRTLQHLAYRVEDTALVVLDFGECLAHVSLTWAARRREIQFRFVGERGEIVGDDTSVRLRADTNEEIDFANGMSGNSSHSEWYAPMFQDFVARVRAERPTGEPLEEAVYVTRLITRAYESSLEGRKLPLMAAPTALEPAPIAMPEPGLDAEIAEEIAAGPVAEKRWRARVLRGATFAVLVAGAAWTFHDVAWAPLWSALSTAHPTWIVLAAIVNLGAVGFQAARWLAVVRPLSRAATIAHTFKAMIIGFAASTIVPARAGELARMQWLSRKTGLPNAAVLGSIVLDHLVNAMGLLVGLAMLPLMLKNVPLWIRPGAWFTLALFTVGAMLVFALRPLGRSRSWARTQGLPMKGVSAFLVSVRQGFGATSRPRALALSLGASFASWALEINVTMIAMRAVGLNLPVAAAILVLLAVNLALALPFAPPGNLGTLEWGATLALLGFGVSKEQALAFGLVYHFLQILPIGLLGLLFAGGSVRRPATAQA